MLSGKGFSRVYNLSGGIKAWEKATAVGPEDQGMHLFTGAENAEDVVIVGYALEGGLREFYLSMAEKVTAEDAAALFTRLADIETLHQKQLLDLYAEITGRPADPEKIADAAIFPVLEGGMTTEEYLERLRPDFSSMIDILSLAMSIEAQALDLYQRAADKTSKASSRRILRRIADEERAHMRLLADFMDTTA